MRGFGICLWVCLLSWSHLAFGEQVFGVRGDDGDYGRDGSRGRHGSTETLVADGRTVTITSAGSAGSDGRSGTSGRSATSCYQHMDDKDERGAHGGNGGSGGDGGRGGNGGNINIQFEDLSLLRAIKIVAPGGAGGDPGHGSYGGEPCRCRSSSWQRQVCENVTKPDGTVVRECYDQTFYCRDGNRGSRGYAGSRGQRGSDGVLRLVPSLEPFPDETPTKSVGMADLATDPTLVSEHLWETRQGASALLASGSIVRDNYNIWQGLSEATLQLDWQAPLSIDHFAPYEASVSIEDGEAYVSFPEDVWIKGTRSTTGGHTDFVVQYGGRTEDIEALDVEHIVGSEDGLKMLMADPVGAQHFVETSFYVEYAIKWGLIYWVAFFGNFDSDYVEVTDGGYSLDFGRLVLTDWQRGVGRELRIKVTATRRYDGRRVSVRREYYQTIGQ